MQLKTSTTYGTGMQFGYTVTLGPFPAGTNVGFYIHANGTPHPPPPRLPPLIPQPRP